MLVIDRCHSGGFTWDLRGHSNRIIMTACTDLQGSYENSNVPNGDFTYNLFQALDHQISYLLAGTGW